MNLKITHKEGRYIAYVLIVLIAAGIGFLLFKHFNDPFLGEAIESTSEVREEEANVEFRIIAETHEYSFAMYMPQMKLGGQWHDMEDKWTPNIADARDSIQTEKDKRDRRQGGQYRIVETTN